ncbi:MAG: adenosylmethionine decarboxylase [Acidovorax sp.]
MLADLYGASPLLLADAAFLKGAASEAAERAGATLLAVHCHPFGPGQGVAGVVLLAESHLTFHTWPEHGFAALDAFMCGDCEPVLAIEYLNQALQAQSRVLRVMERGADSASGPAQENTSASVSA